MDKIKVTSKGQITIPASMREELEIKEGTYLGGYIKDRSIILKPLPGDTDRLKLITYAYKKSEDDIGIARVREMTAGFNLDLSRQVKNIREEEAGE
ncbi:MAG: AbrB/MazE/SpoVT family DNA-binding domain-containing protein [Actinobacteria bacterium]|nr:AbrB/MazE/SpoVT family DNA-binding domain-containing protein [Actinomycetota bacterium]